jgi:hypothetical protein
MANILKGYSLDEIEILSLIRHVKQCSLPEARCQLAGWLADRVENPLHSTTIDEILLARR